MPIFYNNFELGFVPFFRTESVRALVRAVDDSLGIYEHRWGDAPLRYLAVSLFAQAHEVCYFGPEAYPYHHGRWSWRDTWARVVNAISMRVGGQAIFIPGRNRGEFELRAQDVRMPLEGSATVPTETALPADTRMGGEEGS